MADAIIDNEKKINKCPDYILRARKNYYYRQKDKPEFIEKEKERNKKWREANKDKINELARIRRQKKKAEAKAKQEEDAKKQSAKEDADLPALETLAV